MCQQCVADGYLTQDTYNKVEAFLEKWPQAEFGPGHIVLSDCNLLDEHIQFCLDLIDHMNDPEIQGTYTDYSDHDPEEIRETKEFLKKLLDIPETER